MTISSGQVITSADQLKIHDLNGYLNFATPLTVTLASDVLTVVQNFNKVAVQSSTTDTCATIGAQAVGFVLVLIPNNTGHTITFTDTPTPAAGTLSLAGSFSMTGADASLTLISIGASWVEIARTPGMTAGKVIAITTVFA